jgi:hypothetical protein
MSDNERHEKSAPLGISRKRLEQIRDLLKTARKKTRLQTMNLYEVFCVTLYRLKNGCQKLNAKTSFSIVETQIVKNTASTRGKGNDPLSGWRNCRRLW